MFNHLNRYSCTITIFANICLTFSFSNLNELKEFVFFISFINRKIEYLLIFTKNLSQTSCAGSHMPVEMSCWPTRLHSKLETTMIVSKFFVTNFQINLSKLLPNLECFLLLLPYFLITIKIFGIAFSTFSSFSDLHTGLTFIRELLLNTINCTTNS